MVVVVCKIRLNPVPTTTEKVDLDSVSDRKSVEGSWIHLLLLRLAVDILDAHP